MGATIHPKAIVAPPSQTESSAGRFVPMGQSIPIFASLSFFPLLHPSNSKILLYIMHGVRRGVRSIARRAPQPAKSTLPQAALSVRALSSKIPKPTFVQPKSVLRAAAVQASGNSQLPVLFPSLCFIIGRVWGSRRAVDVVCRGWGTICSESGRKSIGRRNASVSIGLKLQLLILCLCLR